MQTFTGIEYLEIDIGNHMGLDKELYNTRIAWVDEHQQELEDLVEQADKPFQYLAAVMAYRDAQQGIPTGHLVGFDACASGIQIMAALTGCATTAKSTGLIGNKRADIYGDTTRVMSQILESEVEVKRSDVKAAQMTHYYGSKAKPKEIFGEGTDEFNAFYAANLIVAPGASELMDVLLASWQPYTMSHDWTMPDGFEVHVKVMVPVDTKIEVDELDHASFVYRHEVNAGTEKGLSIAANTVHSVDAMVVREMARRCNYDYEILRYFQMLFTIILRGTPEEIVEYQPIEQLWRDSGFLSLVGIEHMLTERKIHKKYSHAYLTKLLQLIERTLSRKSFALLTIHDEFKAHANNINVVRQTYAEIMAEIAYSRMLESLLSQIHKKPITFEKYSENLGELILEGNYALS